MGEIEEVSIDVRDVDYTWYEGVKAYLDRGIDRYYFPLASMERLGELDPDTGDAWLIDGQVEAKTEEIEIDGRRILCWSVGGSQLIIRHASSRVRRGGNDLSQG